MSLIQLSKAVDVALLRSLMSSGTADIRNTDRLFSAKAENRVGRLAEEKVPVLRSYITTTSKHADTCQRRPCRRLPCSFPVLNFALSRQNIPPSSPFLPLLVRVPVASMNSADAKRRVEYFGIVPTARYLYENCCVRSKYEVNDSLRVLSG